MTANGRFYLGTFALLLAVAAVYAPGLSGPFLLDDFPNFVHHPLAAIERLDLESLRNAALSNDSGPTGRPLAALSFSLNYWFAGQRFEAFWFKLTNVAIHLVNTLLVLAVLRRVLPGLLRDSVLLSRVRLLALLLAAAWALHPVQLTSVLYVVQRMTSLAGACVLGGLLLYLIGRARLAAGRPDGVVTIVAGLGGGVGLGLLFKENALLLPLYAFVVEYSALDRHALPVLARRFVHGLFTLLVLLPAVVMLAAWAARPSLLSGMFGGRPFTLVERLLTECRVLFDYIAMILAPRPGVFGLFHDDVAISRGLLDPPGTALAVAGWLLLVLAAAWARLRGWRLPAFAVGWFLAGHALESTVFPLEIMHEHRNYLPSLGVLAGALVVIATTLRRLTGATRPVLMLVAALAAAPGALTMARAATWGDTPVLVAATLRHQPSSPRAQLLAAQYALATGALGDAYEHFRRAAQLDTGDVTALLGMLRIVAVAAAGPEDENADADTALPDAYRAPLVRLSPYLAELRRLLAAETDRRLASGPISAGTRTALSRLRACIQAATPECVALGDIALGWYAALYERSELPASVRSMMAADHGRLLVARGEERAALEWLRRAWRAAAEDPQVLVLEAVLQLRLGDFEAAEQTATELARLVDRVGFDARQLQALREAIDRARGSGAGSNLPALPLRGGMRA